jgi:cytochrome c oxidase assembly factor CtaG
MCYRKYYARQPARPPVRLLVGGSAVRVLWERLTSVSVAGVVYAGVFWLWHHPIAYDAALGGEWLHHLEHLMFFAADDARLSVVHREAGDTDHRHEEH